MASVKKSTAAIILLIAMALATSCGNNRSLTPLDCIPADTRGAAVIDLHQIARACSEASPIKDNQLLPDCEEALAMFLPSETLRPMLTVLGAAPQAIDLHQITIITTADGELISIAPCTDPEGLTAALKKSADSASGPDGFECFTGNDRLIAIGRGLCLTAPDAKAIETLLGNLPADPGATIPAIRKFLESDNAVKSAAKASDIYGEKGKGLWMCGALRFSSEAAIAEISATKEDGTPDSIGARIAGEIDGRVLPFIPTGVTAAIASGRQSGEMKLLGLEQLLGQYIPMEIPFDQSSTTAIYLRPAGRITADNAFTPSAWNIAAISCVPDSIGRMAVSDFLATTRRRASLDPQSGIHTLEAGDNSISCGYADGLLFQSTNGPVTANLPSPLTQEFEGARLAAVIDIPAGSSLKEIAGLSSAASLTLKVSTFGIRAKLSFYNSDIPVFKALLSTPYMREILPYAIAINH